MPMGVPGGPTVTVDGDPGTRRPQRCTGSDGRVVRAFAPWTHFRPPRRPPRGRGTAPRARDRAVVEERLARLDLATKVRLLQGETNWRVFAAPDAGLRQVVTPTGRSASAGSAGTSATRRRNIPSPTAVAATWDEDLVERLGALLAGEAAARGSTSCWPRRSTCTARPLGGRHFECFSEDPLLTARVGAAYVHGVQAGGVAATVKHFVANDSETERMTVDDRIDERTLRELYLAPFEHVVADARPWAFMAAYNQVNGVTMTESDAARRAAQGRVGLRRLVMSRLVRHPLDGRVPRARRSTSRCPARPARGATRCVAAVQAGGCRRRRSTRRSAGCCAWPPGSARWTASTPAVPAADPSTPPSRTTPRSAR